MSTEAEIKQFIDRVLRLKEEQDALGEDIREVYAEAKGRGYDKTVLGNVVAHLRKVDKLGRDAISEREAIFEMYLTAYETGVRAPASARTRENIEQFPSKDLSSLTAANAGGDDVNRTRGARSNDGHQVETGGESAATNSPETAEEMDRTAESSFETEGEVAENAREAIPVEPEDGSVSHAGADESSADERNVEATVEQHSSATNFEPPDFLRNAPQAPKQNPQCQKAAKGEACSFSHSMASCWRCTDAAMKGKSFVSKREVA